MIIKHRIVYAKQIQAIKDTIEQWFKEDGEVLVTLESPREDYAMKNASDMLPSAWAGLAWDDRESAREESELEKETIEIDRELIEKLVNMCIKREIARMEDEDKLDQHYRQRDFGGGLNNGDD